MIFCFQFYNLQFENCVCIMLLQCRMSSDICTNLERRIENKYVTIYNRSCEVPIDHVTIIDYSSHNVNTNTTNNTKVRPVHTAQWSSEMPSTAAGAYTNFEVAVKFVENLLVYCYLLLVGLWYNVNNV